jgi:hypothetical protein
MSNITVICWACGEEGLMMWNVDTSPTDVALELWAWLRGHAESHANQSD